MIKVMFVCWGNICRSPMAEFVLKKMVKEKHLDALFHIESRATHTDEIWNGKGNPVYPQANFTDNPRGVADPWYTRDFDATYRDVVEGCTGFLKYLKETGIL